MWRQDMVIVNDDRKFSNNLCGEGPSKNLT